MSVNINLPYKHSVLTLKCTTPVTPIQKETHSSKIPKTAANIKKEGVEVFSPASPSLTSKS